MFESDFRFDMDDSLSMCSQPMSCPSTSTSFSSASPAYDPFTPTSRRSSPYELSTMEFDGYSNVPHRVELTPPSTLNKYMFGPPAIKTEHDHMPYPDGLPNTPLKREHMGFDYMEVNVPHHGSMGSLTPSNSFGMYAISPETTMSAGSFMMTPTQSLSGSEAAETSSSWGSCANESPISFFPHKHHVPSDYESLEMDRHSMSPYHVHDATSPNRMRHQRKMMVHEIQRKTTELQRVSRTTRKRSVKPEAASVDVVRRAMCKCDYPGCTKAFRRNEHLKRHKQTFHGEGPNRFSCEFCGKDQFNRQDNLNNHRKLHARPNSRNRGVEFIPAAVPIIEQEERCRKRRAPPKSKQQQQQQHQEKRVMGY